MSANERGSRFKRFLKMLAVYSAIIVATLAVVDLAMIALNIFPPHHTPGHPELGWVTGSPTGRVESVPCVENSTGETLRYARNEDGIRTAFPAERLKTDTALYKVAVGGDSQTDLCAPNEATHFGVMQSALTAAGIPAATFAYGAGKYSPLQAYLAIKKPAAQYHANALVLNLYTGNDVYDMLRLDDRPHFVKAGDGYRIAPPIWYQEYPPGKVYRSRVLFVLESIARKTGIRNVLVRVRYLRDVARERRQGITSVVRYMNDLRKSASGDVGYSNAFSAQMLNQQLFFHHFPGSREESLARVRALLQLIRNEQPNVLLVLSPIPSYELVRQQPVDSALLKVIGRLPLTYEGGVREEGELYETLRRMAAEEGWLFVDVLAALRGYTGTARLFNDFDYHLLPPASDLVGRAQAAAIVGRIRPPRK